MEGLAMALFFISLLGIISSIVLIIYSAIKKEFKYRPKKLSIGLIGFVVAFICSTIFYSVVQSPESKAKYEANQKAKAEERAQKESTKKEKKSEVPKQQEQSIKEEVKNQGELETKKDEPVSAEVKNEVKQEIQKVDDRFSIKSEPNTSVSVDELILKGKKDSKDATKDNIKEAIKFIKDNYNKYWTDNETMQKTMYYGALLEYSNENKDIKELGLDSEQVVKYVYRKADKIEDDSTQSNLRQIKKTLDKIPSDLKE